MRWSTRPVRLVLAGTAAVVLVALLGPGPAAAHSGSRAQLYLADLQIEPAQPAGWAVHALITDRDSGKPLPGFDVRLTGTSPSGERFGPVVLEDPQTRGDYSGTVTATPGRWSVTVDAREVPGGAEGIPLRQTADVDLAPGTGAVTRMAASRRGGSSSGDGDGVPRWVVPAAIAVLAGGWVLVAIRRRSAEVTG